MCPNKDKRCTTTLGLSTHQVQQHNTMTSHLVSLSIPKHSALSSSSLHATYPHPPTTAEKKQGSRSLCPVSQCPGEGPSQTDKKRVPGPRLSLADVLAASVGLTPPPASGSVYGLSKCQNGQSTQSSSSTLSLSVLTISSPPHLSVTNA